MLSHIRSTVLFVSLSDIQDSGGEASAHHLRPLPAKVLFKLRVAFLHAAAARIDAVAVRRNQIDRPVTENAFDPSVAKEALLLACDTLSPYALLAGRALNCLKAPLAAGEGAAAWRLTAAGSAPVAGITLEAHLEYTPELLKNADLLLAAGDAALPQDLPADLPIATWEEKSGVFCTSSGLGLTAAADSLSYNALSPKLTLKQGSAGALKRIILCETLGQRRFAIVAEHL